ncbi:substrate-binding domain-containing protein [Paragemmobacter straminiformis]|uniref:LacI family DNA-binding transcriptional regulator n=1 Tax=Paragemmobacter straminiformis TaxID=2045119 RepID=A0A842I3J3_9RHOB|nr:LacI family DNA-binding transcriptional regulator [Gemmobacter straminiformis]
MSRPTVNDIAREAGVSLATVDRVLNARPGVREKTIHAVNDAIARLGYIRDMAAANLARSRSYRMAVLLPDGDSQFVQTLADAMQEAAQQAATNRTEMQLVRYPPEDTHALAALLAGLADEGIAGVAVMAPETPVLRDAVRGLRQRAIPVVALVSDLPNAGCDHFIGVDSRAAGRTAGLLMGRFTGNGPRRIAVVAESMLLRDAIERRRGFDEVLLADFPEAEALPTLETHGAPEALAAGLRELLSAGQIGGVYLLGSGHRALTAALGEMGLLGKVVVIGHELTRHSRAALTAGQLHAVIAQNPGHLARSTLRVLRAKADRAPIDEGQEQLRIEIVLHENLPPEPVEPARTSH